MNLPVPQFDRRSSENVKWLSVLVVLISNVAAIAWFAATLTASVATLQRDAASDRLEQRTTREHLISQVGKNSVDIEILKDRELRKGQR